ncbi:MAG: HslU--HslV peptidase ATPase subunit [Campylobacteraceae bacterium 4484_166]|nr:MAG: HslU--HslV peptidase ATPase subunit [Campylobacteraceae bacterium 4484_166]
MDMSPKQIVEYLDDYIIGQNKAKRTIALALRTRYRRMQLNKKLQDEIMPKNILMIGNTGVGKTEIARRLTKMMNLPFAKVEASKYTEVGYVGRDVESMVRDLVADAINISTKEFEEKMKENIQKEVIRKIVQILVPPLPKNATQSSQESFIKTYNKMEQKVLNGDMDDKEIVIKMPKKRTVEILDTNMPMVDMQIIQDSIGNMLKNSKNETIDKKTTVKQAKELLKSIAKDELLDEELIKKDAISKVENGGIIFLDEIDKIVDNSNGQHQDPSKQGVQRDLLPIVEGSSVNTKYGRVSTDHVLFIAAGAFHISSPSDMLPELQGRFPLRVELEALDEEALYKILTNTKNSLLKQYEALLKVEGVTLIFEDEAIKQFAKLSAIANEKTEDIGARRLHTVLEKVLEDISFDADEKSGETIKVTKKMVQEKLDNIIQNEDSTRYIL